MLVISEIKQISVIEQRSVAFFVFSVKVVHTPFRYLVSDKGCLEINSKSDGYCNNWNRCFKEAAVRTFYELPSIKEKASESDAAAWGRMREIYFNKKSSLKKGFLWTYDRARS